MNTWSNWLPMPDLEQGEVFAAPDSPGCYEIRHTFRLINTGMSGTLKTRMKSLLPASLGGTGHRSNHALRDYIANNLNDLEYRFIECDTWDAAAAEKRKLSKSYIYLFER